MPLSFPDAPSVNDTYTAGDIEYTWNGTTWYISNRTADARYGAATGGDSSATITVGGESYTMLTFTASGTLTVTTPGVFDVLVVGGGGGGGTAAGLSCGGGGAGGYREYSKIYFDANQTVTIGAGGAINGTRGAHSRCGQPFAAGGGSMRQFETPRQGASGAGGGYYITPAVGDGISGNNGGSGSGNYNSGGGGGAGAVGGNAGSGVGGAGGAGLDASAFRGEPATTTYYAGGGGGEPNSNGSGGSGGLGGVGGGGNGKINGVRSATAGAANTGGGGGADGAAGGSGIVLVRFKN